MGRKKRNAGNNTGPPHRDGFLPAQTKKQKGEEKYLVKKYRPDKHYDAMDAFVKYTKAHRMLDAAYVRMFRGTTPEKPFVFSIRVSGTDLAWGRGNSRERAMDCACRAAFALVAAHSYNNFPLDEDCLTTEPQDLLPPPPPPPLPPGLPPGFVGQPGGVPPLPGVYPPASIMKDKEIQRLHKMEEGLYRGRNRRPYFNCKRRLILLWLIVWTIIHGKLLLSLALLGMNMVSFSPFRFILGQSLGSIITTLLLFFSIPILFIMLIMMSWKSYISRDYQSVAILNTFSFAFWLSILNTHDFNIDKWVHMPFPFPYFG